MTYHEDLTPRRKRRQPATSSPKRRRLALAMVLLPGALCLTFTAIVLLAYFRPLGPDLVTVAAQDNTNPLPAPAQDIANPTPAPLQQPGQPALCGGPPVTTILVVGSDSREAGYTSGFADAIRLVRVDFITPSAAILSVPRDLWVAIPGLAEQGIIENRIKTTYDYGFVYGVPGGGPSLLAQTLAQNFNLHADHYAVAEFAAFERGVDTLGGLDVNVPQTVGVQDGSGMYFEAGPQHMDGATALRYARQRGSFTDLDRIERQTALVAAIRAKVVSPQVIPHLPELLTTMREAVLTDMSPAELQPFACLAPKIPAENIRLYAIDASMVTADVLRGQEILLPNYDAIAAEVNAFYWGQ